MLPAPNADVWSEILQYFRISLVEDTPKDIHLKRTVIFSVALTCSQLARVALDELWRSMTTLEPVAQVFHTSSGLIGLQYDDSEEYWEITASASDIALHIPQSTMYLRRVHYLHFANFPSSREQALWKVLLNFGGTNLLCPNLRGLLLDMGKGTLSSNHNLLPLLSPSLTDVSFVDTARRPSGQTMVLALLSLLKLQGAQLLEISYKALISPKTFQCLNQFPSLRSLTVTGVVTVPGELLEGVHIASFGNLVNLTTIETDIGAVAKEAEANFGCWLATLPMLSRLLLHGTWREFKDCIFNPVTEFIHLLSLSLFFKNRPRRGVEDITESLFSHIASTFPRLRSLSISASDYQITLGGIRALKEKKMESLRLDNISVGPSPMTLISILTTWPTLRQLSITLEGGRQVFSGAGKILSYASKYGIHLQILSLPLVLSSSIATPSIVPQINCPLRRLEISQPLNLPGTLRERLILARDLMTIFPRLETITSPDGGSDIEELQTMIDIFRDTFSSPLTRPDHLYYTRRQGV